METTDLDAAHRHSSNHRGEIEASETCGCFYCIATFTPDQIDEWIDGLRHEGDGQTALCPKCGIDSVIGSTSGLPGSDTAFLERMHRRWF
ncbi:MAG: hypothetical protein H6834_18745 [Planctomycetes bacterium]|nr:hypothetical protein [Planctomycetota bacterium]